MDEWVRVRSAVLAGVSVVLSWGCGSGPSSEGAARNSASGTVPSLEIIEDRELLSHRLHILDERVAVLPLNGALTLGGSTTSSVTLTLTSSIAPPTVDGNSVFATSVDISGNLAVVTYALPGDDSDGAIDIIDLTNPLAPAIAAQVSFIDTDVLSTSIDGSNIYVALSGPSLGTGSTAAVRRLTYSGTVGDPGIIVGLAGNVATRVLAQGGTVHATSSDGGGLYRLDPTTLAIQSNVSLTAARWVDVEGSVGAVHGGSEVHVFDPGANPVTTTTYALPSASQADAAARLFVAGAQVYATAGANGVHVLSSATGMSFKPWRRPPRSTWG